jgi:hypothetical protein
MNLFKAIGWIAGGAAAFEWKQLAHDQHSTPANRRWE